MTKLRTAAVLTLGLLVGAGAAVGFAQTSKPQAPRLTRSDVTTMMLQGKPSDSWGYFVKDAKSGGCWIVVQQQGVAVAPASACD